MKRLISLLVFFIVICVSVKSQINAKPTDEILKPIFSGGDLEIKKIDTSYAFYYFNMDQGPKKVFLMDNKRSAQDLIDLAKKMYANNNPSESFQFTKPGFTYRIAWINDKVVLYIIPDIGAGTMWIIKAEILDPISSALNKESGVITSNPQSPKLPDALKIN